MFTHSTWLCILRALSTRQRSSSLKKKKKKKGELFCDRHLRYSWNARIVCNVSSSSLAHYSLAALTRGTRTKNESSPTDGRTLFDILSVVCSFLLFLISFFLSTLSISSTLSFTTGDCDYVFHSYIACSLRRHPSCHPCLYPYVFVSMQPLQPHQLARSCCSRDSFRRNPPSPLHPCQRIP
jgi:hypothetical protein